MGVGGKERPHLEAGRPVRYVPVSFAATLVWRIDRMTTPDDKKQTTRNFVGISGDFHTFSNVGDSIEGTLVEARDIQIRGNEARRYKLRQDGGTLISFHGSIEIDDKMREVQDGQYVRITLMGETPTSGGNNVKQFNVEVAQ
jgi:hypothetical protein